MIADDLTLEARFDRADGQVLLTGIQALVRLPMEITRFDERAGRRTAVFVSGYEGSPLGGYDLALQRERDRLSRHRVHHQPGVNEELAATAVWGSQQVDDLVDDLDGVVGLWYGKSPGLDRAGDAIRHANMMGVGSQGGAVALVGDDPACKSSTIPSASEETLAGLGLPVLAPATSQEIIELGLHAVAISRFTGGWTSLKIVTDVADGFGTVTLDPDLEIRLPVLQVDGAPWAPTTNPTLPPHSVRAEPVVLRGRRIAAEAYARENGLNRIVGAEDATVGIIAAGKTYLDVRAALRDLGLGDDAALAKAGVRLLHLRMMHPLEPDIVVEFARGLAEIVVVEEKRAFTERAVRDVLYPTALRPAVVGEQDDRGAPLIPVDGDLTADRIRAPLARRLSDRLPADQGGRPDCPDRLANSVGAGPLQVALPMVSRSPWFCSGCPHNRSTIVPDGSLVGAGIGCHAMVQMSGDERRVGETITQMGGEGAQWIGMAPFSARHHAFQNIGDGTFFHSGSLAIRAAVDAGTNITFKLLYNGTVAMTGGQDPAGARQVPDVATMLLAEGVRQVVVVAEDPDHYPTATRWPPGVTLRHRDELDRVQRELQRVDGVTVLIYDQECAAEARRARKRGRQPAPTTRVFINERVCEGCGDCGHKSNCLSVHPVDTTFGRKTRIHQSSCNYDYSCLDGDCPSFVTVEVLPASAATPSPTVTPPSDLPMAPTPDRDREWNLYLLGIGGTGIVTVNQVLATAAQMEGRAVVGLDQTGLSQKGGPVVSHLKVRPSDAPEGGSRVTQGSADAYLAFDIVVAADPQHLAMADPVHTAAVVSTSLVPTGSMVADPDTPPPSADALRTRIDTATRTSDNVYLDALRIAEDLLGDHMAGNMVVIGAAYQAGLLPMSLETLRAAVRLNNVAVEMNLTAIEWGRAAVAAPAALAAALDRASCGSSGSPPPQILPQRVEEAIAEARFAAAAAELVTQRASDLVAYQDTSLAVAYVEKVTEVWRRERVIAAEGRLTQTVAHHLHKLLAYKDEYEVARLYVDDEWQRQLEDEVPGGRRIRIRLHPPMLRALGMQRKIAFGPWVLPLLRLLYRARRLRGTAFDPFGRTKIRRTERQLVRDYLADIDLILKTLDESTYESVIVLAGLPDMVRGYEQVKLDSVQNYRGRRDQTRQELTTD